MTLGSGLHPSGLEAAFGGPFDMPRHDEPVVDSKLALLGLAGIDPMAFQAVCYAQTLDPQDALNRIYDQFNPGPGIGPRPYNSQELVDKANELAELDKRRAELAESIVPIVVSSIESMGTGNSFNEWRDSLPDTENDAIRSAVKLRREAEIRTHKS